MKKNDIYTAIDIQKMSKDIREATKSLTYFMWITAIVSSILFGKFIFEELEYAKGIYQWILVLIFIIFLGFVCTCADSGSNKLSKLSFILTVLADDYYEKMKVDYLRKKAESEE